MTFKHWGLASTVLAGALLSFSPAAEQNQNTKPNPNQGTVGKTVDSAVQSIKKGAQSASDAVREQYQKARTSIHNMGVSSRIYGRVHWDKALVGHKIDIDVQRDGVATLTGTVPNAAARAKAVELTKDTVGVTRVVDRLTVVTTAPTTPTPAKP
jgi:osmotically-inducible protein OsmY